MYPQAFLFVAIASKADTTTKTNMCTHRNNFFVRSYKYPILIFI